MVLIPETPTFSSVIFRYIYVFWRQQYSRLISLMKKYLIDSNMIKQRGMDGSCGMCSFFLK